MNINSSSHLCHMIAITFVQDKWVCLWLRNDQPQLYGHPGLTPRSEIVHICRIVHPELPLHFDAIDWGPNRRDNNTLLDQLSQQHPQSVHIHNPMNRPCVLTVGNLYNPRVASPLISPLSRQHFPAERFQTKDFRTESQLKRANRSKSRIRGRKRPSETTVIQERWVPKKLKLAMQVTAMNCPQFAQIKNERLKLCVSRTSVNLLQIRISKRKQALDLLSGLSPEEADLITQVFLGNMELRQSFAKSKTLLEQHQATAMQVFLQVPLKLIHISGACDDWDVMF